MLDKFISQLNNWHLVSSEVSRVVLGNDVNSFELIIVPNNNGFMLGIRNKDNTPPFDDFLDDPRISSLSLEDIVIHINEDLDYVLMMD